MIGRLPVIAPLDALGVDDLARILQSTKGSLIQQFRKLVRFHGADLMFTDAAVREIARMALEGKLGPSTFPGGQRVGSRFPYRKWVTPFRSFWLAMPWPGRTSTEPAS